MTNDSNLFQPIAQRIKAPIYQEASTNSSAKQHKNSNPAITKIDIHELEIENHLLAPDLSQTLPTIPIPQQQELQSSRETPSNVMTTAGHSFLAVLKWGYHRLSQQKNGSTPPKS